MGGGTGANALHICNFLRSRLGTDGWEYTLLDVSPGLTARQRERLAFYVGSGNVRVLNVDASDVGALLPIDPNPNTVVLALEVADNLVGAKHASANHPTLPHALKTHSRTTRSRSLPMGSGWRRGSNWWRKGH